MITYRQLEKYSYISFDVFDTLIRRSVARPEDLFELMEMFGAPKTFSQKRRDTERLAGEELGRHASLDEIYERMEEGSKSFKELEIQLEIDGCQPNPHYAALFRQCVEAGKTVLLITDMYLSADVIGQMLKKCGLVGYHKLYISSEQAAQKSDGTLYHKILHDLQIKPGQLCHIGDNLNGDVIKPHSQGMGAVWARKKRKYACYIPRDAAGNDALMHRTMQACVRNARERLSEVEQQGCTVLGPLLYGFTVWLAQMLQSDGIHEVYFLSREGLVLKRAFDSLRIPGIKTHYLYGSRKAYIVPLLWKCESIEEALFYITSSDSMTMRMFFVQIGLDPDHYIDLLAEYGIEMDRRYARATFTGSEAIQKVFKRIMPDIEAESKREYEAVTSYLHDLQMGGGYRSGRYWVSWYDAKRFAEFIENVRCSSRSERFLFRYNAE